MGTKDIKKIIFAYSGGLGTSTIIPWLEENYNDCKVVAASADVGQGVELDELGEKVTKTSTSRLYILDLKDEFVEDYIHPCLKANAIYEDIYLLSTVFTRSLTGQKLVKIAKRGRADAICHGCAGEGSNQMYFELTIKVFVPDVPIITSWRTRELKPRDDEIDYTEAHNTPLKISREANYSRDKNLWHLGHGGLDLEDPMDKPQYNDILGMGVTPEQAPGIPTYITLTFEKGIPAVLSGERLGGQAVVIKLNEIGDANGIGIIGMVEDRLVGMKNHDAHETPGGIVLYRACQ